MLDIIILFFTSFQFCDHLCHSANQSGPDAESHQKLPVLISHKHLVTLDQEETIEINTQTSHPRHAHLDTVTVI